jgi:predicted lipoprotein with Yx(FWY)xxD motif
MPPRRALILIRNLLPIVVIASLALIWTTGADSSSSSSKPAGTVKTRSTDLGTIVTDGKGRTLYLFEKDRAGKSACSGACAANWPPLLVRHKPTRSGGARSALLGTTRRADGTKQLTYGGHPLYTYSGDGGKAGSTKGQGLEAFGAEWYVVGPTGRKIEHEDSDDEAPSSGGGY